MTRPDDSSLSPEQQLKVRRTAVALLDKAAAWDRFPTPVADLLEAANLKVAPVSAFDESAIEHYARRLGAAAKNFLKSAIGKVLGILDVFGNVVHVDPDLNKEKQNFLKLHEAGHSELPHQRSIFRWIQECRETLEPETSELFEREANVFAGIALFQDSRFATMTADSPFGIKVPLSVGRRFGASAYASIRQYVRGSTKACAVVVLETPRWCNAEGMTAVLRRTQLSDEFQRRFGELQLPLTITPANGIASFIPVAGKRMSRPGTLPMQDRNGVLHEFIAEGFSTPRNVFILLHACATLNRTTIILPAEVPSRS